MTEGIEIWEASSVSQTDNEDPRSDLVDVRLGLSSVTGVATVDVCVATVVVCVVGVATVVVCVVGVATVVVCAVCVATVVVCVATVVVCVATVGVYVATEFAACFVESDEDSK